MSPPPRLGMAVAAPAALRQAAAAGFDYAALHLETLASADAETLAQYKDACRQSGIAAEICLSILPPGVAVTARGFNLYYWLDYLKRALERLEAVGCRALLWRDAHARALPLEGDATAAKAQCLQFIYMLCRLCDERGMAVLVEPLAVAAADASHLSTLGEVEQLIAQIGKGNVHAALSLADAAALGSAMRRADGALRIRHLSAPALPAAAVPVLHAAGEVCPLTVLGAADKDALDKARRRLCSHLSDG